MTRTIASVPSAWTTAELDDLTIGLSTTGKKVRTKDTLPVGLYPVIDQGAAACSGYLNDEACLVLASPEKPVILFGDHTRIVKFIERPFIPGADGTKLLQAKEGVSPRYFYYLLNAVDVPDRGYGRHFGHLRSADLPLAPELEQKRIADKLDTVLTRVDAVNTRLARVAPLLKRFRQSVLAAATSGRLTEDWRQETLDVQRHEYQSTEISVPYPQRITAPETWKPQIFDQVVELVGGSQPPKTTFVHEERPGYVRLIQIRDYKSDRHLTFIPRELARRFCSVTDVMIGRYGPPIFQILRGLEGAYNVALMKAVPRDGLLTNDYLYYWLQRDDLLRFVEAGSDRTAGQDGVRKDHLIKYPVFVPTVQEQTEIVRRVETLFAFADRLEARLQTAQTAANRLTPALLAKAFRGELVPQDPNDEPASELLKRLAGSAPVSPARRGRSKASKAD